MGIRAKFVDGVFKPLEEVPAADPGKIYLIFAEDELAREKKRILLVDDEPGITRTLKLFLEATGKYEVRTENEGSRGLPAAREFKPDLILLDIVMPDKDGSELAAEIRADPGFTHTPIAFLTALVSKQDVGKGGRTIGGYPFLAKPLDPEQVVEFIEKQLTP